MEPDKGKSTFDEIEKWLSKDYSWTRLYFDDPYETVLEMLPSFSQNLSFFYSLNENRSLEFGTSILQHMRKQKTTFSLQSLVIVFPVCMTCLRSKANIMTRTGYTDI